ncbi:unnamed protein product, partial [Allacma fusca]
VLFTRELARRLGPNSNITCYALCPGLVFTVKIKDQNIFLRLLFNTLKYLSHFELEEGCLTTLHCALSNKAG